MADLAVTVNNTGMWPEAKDCAKIGIVGDMGVGKTCLLRRFQEKCFPTESQVTLGTKQYFVKVPVKCKQKNTTGTVTLQLCDTAKTEQYNSLDTSYYESCKAIVVVYGLQDQETFDHIQYYIGEGSRLGSEELPLFIVGNKTDITNADPSKKIKGTDELKSRYPSAKIRYISVKASQTEVDRLFEEVATAVVNTKAGSDKFTAGAPSVDRDTRTDSCCCLM